MSPKSVLITGCSVGGIGHALAISFQKRGFTVFATARSTKKMQDLASLSNVHLITLDVTSTPSIDAAVAEVSAQTNGKLDVLVNNAGAQFIMPALDIDITAAKAFFDVNYWAALEMVQKFGTMLIAAKGCVVNVSSSAGVATLPFQSTLIRCALLLSTVPYTDMPYRSV
jgi:1-acylglycerone phosphate reductase